MENKLKNIKPNTLVEKLNRQNDIGENRLGYLRMDKNERIVDFDKKIFNQIINSFTSDDLTAYADQTNLYKALSKKISVGNNSLLLTPGSDSAIKYIYESFVKKNDIVGYLWPTYAMIDVYANLYGARKFKINYTKKFDIDYKSIDKFLKKKPKILFIANPNQPTGTIIPDKDLDKIIFKCNKSKTLVVLDQAYIEFSNVRLRYKDTKKYKNLIITNTFSKAYGLAGLRIGYIVSNPEVISILYKVKPLSDINAIALKAAEYLVKNNQILKNYVTGVNKSKKIVSKFCEINNIKFINSHTNFVHMYLDADLNKISQKMKKRKYLIRTTGKGLPATIENCIRITLGPPKVIKEFLLNFKEVLNEVNHS